MYHHNFRQCLAGFKPRALALLALATLMPLSSCLPETVITTATTTATITATTTAVTTLTVTADPYDLSYLVDADPADIDNSSLPVTPLALMHVIGVAPDVDIAAYRFAVTGLVANPLSLSYDDLKSYAAESRVVLLICPQTFADNPLWTGIPLTAVLEAAGAQAEAAEVVLRSLDGFEMPLPLSIAPDILLAYEVDGAALPPEHGFPLRAVVKGRIGVYWLRWLEGIEIR